MDRRLVFAVAGWVVAALAATVAGLVVIGAFGGAFRGPGDQALSAEAVRRELALPAPPVSSPTPRPSAAATASRVVSTEGGTVVVSCTAGRAQLTSWTPAQGWQTDDVEPGPGGHAKVKFERGEAEVEVETHCEGDVPRTVVTDD
ncbi:hypothetical protein [Herbidospora sp. NBRC 101105]|uniref:hypothetical protein n=1 Tax=Herbidospora sp. NBRC 101105 TaxID=3032195 RepID=UPI002557539A|nr:hypothetical protein [Herbidospora sp. NBRC 101105]